MGTLGCPFFLLVRNGHLRVSVFFVWFPRSMHGFTDEWILTFHVAADGRA